MKKKNYLPDMHQVSTFHKLYCWHGKEISKNNAYYFNLSFEQDNHAFLAV